MNYLCNLSGASAPAYDMSISPAKPDALEDAPVGWTKITIQRRIPNNQWRMLQMAKESAMQEMEAALQQAGFEGDLLNVKMAFASAQQDALFYAAEHGTPPFLIEEEVLWVANTADAIEVLNEVRDVCGLPPAEVFTDGGADEDEDSTPSEG